MSRITTLFGSLPTCFACLVVTLTLTACGGGGGGGGGSNPTTPPPPPNPSEALVIDDTNAIDTLTVAASLSEGIMALGVLAMEQVILIANDGSLTASANCDSGGTISVDVDDVDVSGNLTAGDTIDVTLTGGCRERVIGDPAEGTFVIELTSIFTGYQDEAVFRGTLRLTDALEIEGVDSIGPITTTVEGPVEFGVATSGQVIEGFRLTLSAGEEVVFTVGTNRQPPSVERVTSFEFSRRVFRSDTSDNNYSVRYDLGIESELLGGSVSCSTDVPISGIDFGTPPVAGRLDCVGASNSAVRLLSDRGSTSDPLVVELDDDGDGSFDLLVTQANVFWSNFIEGVLYEEFVDDFVSAPIESTFGTVTSSGIDVAANDIAYSAVNDRLYVSNSTGILEVNPSTLLVERTGSVTGIPTVLAPSDDGSTLWYGLENENRVGRLTIQDFQAGADVQLGASRIAGEIVVAPGSTDLIVVSMLSSNDVVAFNNGVELPGQIDRGPNWLVARSPTAWVGASDDGGFDGYEITLDPTAGLTVIQTHRVLAPASDSPIALGNDDVFAGSGFIFDERGGVRKGLLKLSEETPAGSLFRVAPDVANGRIFGIGRSEPRIDIFDEVTRARVGSYRHEDPQIGLAPRHLLLTNDSLVAASSSRLLTFPLAELVPNLPSKDCDPIVIDDLLREGTYQVADCVLTHATYDAARELVYASLPGSEGPNGNAIVVMDATSLESIASIPVNGSPTALFMSPDGDRLYAPLDNASLLVEVDLDTRTLTSTVPLGYQIVNGDQRFAPQQAIAIAESPANAQELVAAMFSSEVVFFRSDLPLQDVARNRDRFGSLHFNDADSTMVVAHAPGQVDAFSLTGNGIAFVSSISDAALGTQVVERDNVLYGAGGGSFDIATLNGNRVCANARQSDIGSVAVDSTGTALYFARSLTPVHLLFHCDPQTTAVTDPDFVPFFGQDRNGIQRGLFIVADGTLIYVHDGALLKLSAPTP